MTDLSEEALDKLVTQLGAIRFTAMRANHAVLGPRPIEAANNALHQAIEVIIALRAQNAAVDEWKARAEKAEADLAAMTDERDRFAVTVVNLAGQRDAMKADRDNAARWRDHYRQAWLGGEVGQHPSNSMRARKGAAAGKAMTLPATEGDEGEPA